jgi:type IV pilus assembly protein PilQ
VRTALALALALLPCGAAAGDTPKGDAPQVEPGAAQLRDVEVTEQRDFTVVKLRTSGAAKYRARLIGSPYRLVLDLEGAIYAGRAAPFAVGREPVKQVRGAQFREDVARVVVEFTRKVGYLIREDGDGLTVMVPTPNEARSAPDAEPVSPATVIPSRAVAAAAAAASVGDSPATPVPVPSESATAGRAAPIPPATPRRAAATRVPNGRSPLRLAQAPPPDGSGPRLISLEFKDADVVNLLRILAAESGRNVVIGEDVKGKMSISLRSVPWGVAMQTVLDTKGLAPVEREGILRIVTREQLLKDLEAEAKLAKATVKPEPRGPLREETIRLYYADAEEVAGTLQGILGIGAAGQPVQAVGPGAGPIAEPPFSRLYGPPGEPPPPGGPPVSPIPEVLAEGLTIRAHKPTNSLFLRLWERDLERVKKIIRQSLDIQLPQVKIEARMEILDRSALQQIGIQWGGATAQPAGSYTIVTRGLETVGGVPVAPGGIPVTGFARGNPGLTLTQGLPISAASGLPLGGNLVNLPTSALPTGALPAAGLAFGIVGSRLNINLALQALATQGKTRTLARPEIVTVENAKATMSLGEEIPYATVSSAGTQVQFKEAALRLEVTPVVIREPEVTRIKMTVVVENNSRGDSLTTAAGSAPVINKRRAETKVLVTEGQRLVIGGATTNVNQQTVRKVPIFGDIPLLGWLFKQQETTDTGRELVIFLTPTVIQALNRGAAATAPAAK